MRLAQARAEESIVRAHVDNALMFVDTLAEELSFDRAIDSYVRVMGIPEPLAGTVATRACRSDPLSGREIGPGSGPHLLRDAQPEHQRHHYGRRDAVDADRVNHEQLEPREVRREQDTRAGHRGQQPHDAAR